MSLSLASCFRVRAASLAGLLAVLLSAVVWWQPVSEIQGLRADAPLPEIDVAEYPNGPAGTLRQPAGRPASCMLIAVCSPNCRICGRMRFKWPGRAREWSRAVGAPVDLVWLSTGDVASQAAFYAEFDFEGVRLLLFADNPAKALRRLGVVGTPTIYLVDKHGYPILGILGDTLPGVDAGFAACR